MSKNFNMVLAGFGGQGILFAGKVIAYAGLMDGQEVSWLPSYGPEMRGGTANCSVCLSDEPIGSPQVLNPDVLIAMNLPSYEKFIKAVVPGGKVFIDSSLSTLPEIRELSSEEALHKAIEKCVPARKAHLKDANLKAIQMGMSL